MFRQPFAFRVIDRFNLLLSDTAVQPQNGRGRSTYIPPAKLVQTAQIRRLLVCITWTVKPKQRLWATVWAPLVVFAIL